MSIIEKASSGKGCPLRGVSLYCQNHRYHTAPNFCGLVIFIFVIDDVGVVTSKNTFACITVLNLSSLCVRGREYDVGATLVIPACCRYR